MLKAIIIDDEAKSREVLKSLLSNFCEGVDVIAMADDVKSGFIAIKNNNPDVVFFDISLKTGDSFEIIDKLGIINFQPVFVTAFDEFSVKALNFSNLPCMFKPIDIEELSDLVENIKLKKYTEFNRRYKIARALMNSGFDTIPIKHQQGMLMLDIGDLIYIENGDKDCSLVCNDGKYLSEKSFSIFKEILVPKSFTLLKNKYLINTKYVLKENSNKDEIQMINGDKLS